MKKTIAKIMAAAMVLSAVPAVALPTMTAEAGLSATPSVASDAATDSDDNVVISSDGSTGIYLGTDLDYVVQTGSLAAPTAASTDDVFIAFMSNDTAMSGVNGAKLEDVLNVAVNKEGYLTMTANTKASNYMKVILNAVSTGKTEIDLRIYSDSYGKTSGSVGTLAYGTTSSYYEATRYFAGNSDKDGVITENVGAKEGTLRSGDIHVKLVNTEKAEVEVLKGDRDDILDSNDALRGQMLNLNKVVIGGFEYDVVKIGAQALKKAHMKKLKAENVKKIGKGALRKCKNMKHADFQDSNKIRKILGKAFYDCKNLNTIIIDGRKLKTVGKDAFHGVKKNCTVKIKAKKSKFESDKKMILKNGGNKNLKFVRK